jgi:hypothetical protein
MGGSALGSASQQKWRYPAELQVSTPKPTYKIYLGAMSDMVVVVMMMMMMMPRGIVALS